MTDRASGISIERLKDAATNATPGPWPKQFKYGDWENYVVAKDADEGQWVCTAQKANDATYIAAASPDVVLSLIKQLESLQGIVLAAFQALGGNCTSTDTPADLPKRISELVSRHNGLLCTNGELNQEADWLADKLSCACSVSTDDKCGIPTPCPNSAGCACLDVEPEDWREAARKAVQND